MDFHLARARLYMRSLGAEEGVRLCEWEKDERINKEMIDMKQQIKNMEITLERVQKQEKKNNLIVKGLTIENEDEEEVKTYIGNFNLIVKGLTIENEDEEEVKTYIGNFIQND
ncbi:hypothetical protein QE152_g36482 [Popillia japonica]|uniref:Uncharacterized protein n=1 Tax=Popillia japonica TaxID=7064 RepID=A0AAW1ID57_POPJA